MTGNGNSSQSGGVNFKREMIMTAAEKVHYWMLKYKLQNSELPKSDEILAQLEMAIEYENKTTQK